MRLRVENLSKEFSSNISNGSVHKVLEDVNFEVQTGQFVTLLGPSGCGKTTLLSIIAGFQKPTSGCILLDGHEVNKPGPDRGYVFQDYALFPWMTVRNNILYPMKQLKLPRMKREARLKKLLAMVHLEGKENLYPHQLSGGMKQRTAFIRALATHPEVLLMDEPLGAVDFQMRQGLQEELEAIWLKNKTTVIMVTHDVEEAIYMSDRVLVMSMQEGKITENLTVDLARPRERKGEQYYRYKDHLMDVLKVASRKGVEGLNDRTALMNRQQADNLRDVAQ